MPRIIIEMLGDEQYKPIKAHDGDAGYDIFAVPHDGAEGITIGPLETKVIPAGFKMEIPYGYEAQVRSRSGNALKRKFMVANSPGTIDSNYRGEVGVIIFNTDKENSLLILKGDKIAQLVISKLPQTRMKLGKVSEDTDRGKAGFGSTGMR